MVGSNWIPSIWILGVALAVASGCSEPAPPPPTLDLPARAESIPPYRVSEAGGTPATGPGERYNFCERIWCAIHGENYSIEHYLADHVGWIVHDGLYGDLFTPGTQSRNPAALNARPAALFLCGSHVHPRWIGGGSHRGAGFNHRLGYSRQHFAVYGTRLEPCCINGLGSGFVHSNAARRFSLDRLDDYRAHPDWGWQRPFAARIPDM